MIAGPDVTVSGRIQARRRVSARPPDDVRGLDDEVSVYVAQGFHVEERTDTFLTLRRPRRFSWWRCLLLLGVFYVPLYLRQRDEVIHFHRDIGGEVYRLG